MAFVSYVMIMFSFSYWEMLNISHRLGNDRRRKPVDDTGIFVHLHDEWRKIRFFRH